MSRKPTHIRAWRKHRGHTLEDVLGRLEVLGMTMTAASLSRIERGIQPYSQDILEALSDALNVAASDLLENDPCVPEAEIYDLVRHLKNHERDTATAVLKAMFPR